MRRVGKGDPAHFRGPRLFGKTGAMALRAGFLGQEAFDFLHALFVLYFGKRIFDGIDGIIVREVKFTGNVRTFSLVKDMFLHGRTMIDDVLFLCCKILKRNIGPHAHGAGNLLHQGPHQGLPRKDGPFING